jgi:hypothetical protein
MILSNDTSTPHYHAVTLLLDAGHGEYVPTMAQVVWWDNSDDVEGDEYTLASPLPNPAAVAKYRESDPAFGDPDEGNGWQKLIAIRGTLLSIKSAYLDFAAIVASGPSGGDDSTYDYWPSAVRLCQDWARDLDEITGRTGSEMSYLRLLNDEVRESIESAGHSVDDFNFLLDV